MYPVGVSKEGVDESVISVFGPRTVTCVNAEGGRAGFDVCGEYVRKLGPRHRAGRTCPGADLRRYQ